MPFRFDSTKTTVIYRLIDPRDGQTRYIGYTQKDLLERWKQHIYFAKKTPKYHRDWWILRVLADNETPHIEELDFGVWDAETASAREDYWIQAFGGLGGSLTNQKLGGIGCIQLEVSEETRRLLGEASRRAWADVEYRANKLQQITDYWDGNDRARSAVSLQATERWADPDYSARKTLQSPEYRAKRSEIAKNVFNRPEMKSWRRECSVCGMVSTPAGMGTHQSKSGHAGFLDHVERGELS